VADALDVASQQACDLLISDLGLPDRTGLDLMREVRTRYPLKGIALTGYADDQDVADSSAAGFAMHLKKPVDFNDLLAAIRDVASA
jgi:CheY-like chemotaxis protein